jgi:hypothetical protein
VSRPAIAACVACAACLVAVAASPASAAPITVGLFAPAAPFPSTAARVELANRLGAALGNALHRPVSGRVYARAADFAAAVKRGEVTLALVDAAYLASGGTGYTVIAASHGADDRPERAWQLVARAGVALTALQGKRVLVPSLGGREADFVINALLGGAIGHDFFAAIEPAPDTASALAALGLGKADVAIVPGGPGGPGGKLPDGTAVLLALPVLPDPVLVAYGPMSAEDRAAVQGAVAGFQGDATIAGFRGAEAEIVRGVARRFSAPVRTGPFAVPAARLVVGDLVQGRAFVIERTTATAFAIIPPVR